MFIYIDNQRLPITPRTTRDLLIALKNIAKTQNWGLYYDTTKETVLINTKSPEIPLSNKDNTGRREESESKRLDGKIICLDPGHGGNDPGAIGPSGTMEKDNVLAIALLLRDRLEKHGATVILTRENDQDVSFANASASEELGARVDITNDAKADIFISLHNDAFTNPTACGTTTFHYGDSESIKLANCVQECLVNTLGTKNRGSRFASFYVIRYSNMTAILVEVAFISNSEEEVLLASSDGRNNAAQCIFDGILKYYKV